MSPTFQELQPRFLDGGVFDSRVGSAAGGPLPWQPVALLGICSQLCNTDALLWYCYDEDADKICEMARVDQDLP